MGRDHGNEIGIADLKLAPDASPSWRCLCNAQFISSSDCELHYYNVLDSGFLAAPLVRSSVFSLCVVLQNHLNVPPS